MRTIQSLIKGGRARKKQKKVSLAMQKKPQVRGVCTKVTTMTPCKPNSAVRKITKVKLTTGYEVVAYIRGEGHNLQVHNSVLIQKGGPKDLPGVKFNVVRGCLDLAGVKGRKKGRSLYGVKKNAK